MSATATCPRCGRTTELVTKDGELVFNVHQLARRVGAPRCPNSMQPARR